jgi:cell division protein ZapE
MKILDSRQKEIMQLCKQIALSIKPNTFLSKVKNLFYKEENYNGVYMHGSVGGGKTMLMKMFYEEVSVPKEIIHFQKFMQVLHIKLHLLQARSAHRVVQELAADIASKAQVVCMDEFEIRDITDAMIIMRLFRYLAKCGVFIFLTTNTMLDNLYKDGLQRESFLPFIKMIKRKFQILYLDTNKDYRYDSLVNVKNRILYPIGDKTHKEIKEIKQELCDEAELSMVNIEVFGREMSFKQVHQNILFTDFDELFSRDLGYADYVSICEHFKIIVLESVRIIAEDEVNIITRFINFIDNAYFYKVLLFIEIECDPVQIYTKGKRIEEFARIISRLKEMNSRDYLNEDL